MPVCSHCGNVNRVDLRFCTSCGRPLAEDTTVETDAPTLMAPTPVAATPSADRLAARLGPRAVDRPPPDLEEGLTGVGGFLFAAGVIGFGGQQFGESGSNGLLVFLALALIAASVAVLARGPVPLHPAAVAASAVAAPSLGFALFAAEADPSISLAAFVTIAVLAGLYFGGPRRGHTTHLAVLAVAGWLGAVALVQSDVFIGGEVPPFGSVIADIGAISVLVGLVYLGVGWWLDRSGLRGTATPVLVVGAVALPAGGYAAVNDGGALLAGLLGVLTAATVTVVGAVRARRGLLWFGLVLIAIAVGVVIDGIAPDTDGENVAFFLVMVFGAGLVYVARYVTGWVRRVPS